LGAEPWTPGRNLLGEAQKAQAQKLAAEGSRETPATAASGVGATSGYARQCPPGERVEPRIDALGRARDACISAGTAGPSVEPAALAASEANPLDAPLDIDSRAQGLLGRAGAAQAPPPAEPADTLQSELTHNFKEAENARVQLAGEAADAGRERRAAADQPSQKMDLTERFSAAPLAGVSATRLGNLSMIWAKGGGVDCVLDGRIDTTLSGYVTCTIADDVYSADGQTVLVPKGSLGFVEYRSVHQAGQHRFEAIVSSIRTPDGITLQLDSGAQGRLGETGASGYLDNQWGARLGAALVVAVVGDLAQYEENKALAQSTNGAVVVQPENTSQTLASMPQEILSSTLNIKPRIIKAQGETIRVVAARDINFATVYRLVNASRE
jgi:type IV secretion system protein VirB10